MSVGSKRRGYWLGTGLFSILLLALLSSTKESKTQSHTALASALNGPVPIVLSENLNPEQRLYEARRMVERADSYAIQGDWGMASPLYRGALREFSNLVTEKPEGGYGNEALTELKHFNIKRIFKDNKIEEGFKFKVGEYEFEVWRKQPGKSGESIQDRQDHVYRLKGRGPDGNELDFNTSFLYFGNTPKEINLSFGGPYTAGQLMADGK